MVTEYSDSNTFSELDASKQFEHFTAFCIFSSRDPDEIETEDLMAGDGGDLNIDAFAVKVNGRLIEDADGVDDTLDMSGSLDVESLIVQTKTSHSFDGAAVLALGDNLVMEVFAEVPTLPMNDDIKRFIEIKSRVFKNAAKLKDNPVCRVFYAAPGIGRMTNTYRKS